jgi:hypothetical protein
MKGVVLAALLAVSGTALANEEGETPLVGFYAGAGGGAAIIDDDDFKDNDTSFKIVGGFRLDKYYGFELAYLDNGDQEENGLQISSTAFEASILGFYPFNNTFTVFGKVGNLSSDVDVKINGIRQDDDSDDSLLYGAGVLINLPKSTSLRLEVQAAEISDADIWIATLSGIYRFKI